MFSKWYLSPDTRSVNTSAHCYWHENHQGEEIGQVLAGMLGSHRKGRARLVSTECASGSQHLQTPPGSTNWVVGLHALLLC